MHGKISNKSIKFGWILSNSLDNMNEFMNNKDETIFFPFLMWIRYIYMHATSMSSSDEDILTIELCETETAVDSCFWWELVMDTIE